MATVMLQAILAMEPAYSCISILLSLCLVCLTVGAQAQERSRPDPPGYFGLPSLPTLEDQPSKPPESPILPPLPPPAPEERQRLPQQVHVFVRQIKVEGNTVFPREKLEEITKRYINRELTT
jgi:hemolysin activation/secretion protein